MTRLCELLTVVVLLMSCGSDDARSANGSVRHQAPVASSGAAAKVPPDPLDQMVLAFKGGYTRSQIKARLDQAMQLYGLPLTSEHYSRAGSSLVVMRKESGFSEMEILDYMIRSHVPGVAIEFPQMAAWAATALESGDR